MFLGRWTSRARGFLSEAIWRPSLEDLSHPRAALYRALRIATTAVEEFFADQAMLRASALTFYSLLSIVPLFAVLFGIAKGFGLENMLERRLVEQLAGQEELLERILAFARNTLENARGGLIAGVGVLVMFGSAIQVMRQIESALNAMWEVKRPRGLARRFADYLAVLLCAPILFLVAGSASVFAGNQFALLAARFEILQAFGPLVQGAIRLMPLVLMWALFALFYKAMPNTSVGTAAASFGAAVAAVLYLAVQWVIIDLQVGAAEKSAIYGSFAAIPLFLVWMQTSWMIFLFGAELSYAWDHCEGGGLARGGRLLNAEERKIAACCLARQASLRFLAGEEASDLRGLARAAGIPIPAAREAAAALVAAGILCETAAPSGKAPLLLPAMEPRRMTLERVCTALDRVGAPSRKSTTPPSETEILRRALERFRAAAAGLPENLPLAAIAGPPADTRGDPP
ncbi:MAG: YihY/virulence factor BrkB family protein [Desulfobacterales bacterium]